MKLALPKSFLMMKLLNYNYGVFIRASMAFIGFTFAVMTTGRLKLAQELAARFWTHNDFKVGVRRGAWYGRRSWLNLDISTDDSFDPTEGMSDFELDALASFVIARKAKLAPIIYASDMAIIAARRLNNNTIAAVHATNVVAFKTACDTLLAQPPDLSLSLATADKLRVGDFPIENAKQTLADFSALFPPADMRWFFISGTFLGLIRENGFLAHDYDIDLGVFENDIDIAATIRVVEDSDTFVLKKYDHHKSTLFQPKTPAKDPDVPYILKLVHVLGVHIDLFIHYRDISTEPAIDWHGSSLHRWENSAFDLTPYPFYDMTVLGPANADRYLTENYGDWRTPVTEFNCTTDTPNLALVPHPIAIVIFLKRYVLARQTDPKQAAKLEQELLHNGFLRRSDDSTLTFSGDLFAK